MIQLVGLGGPEQVEDVRVGPGPLFFGIERVSLDVGIPEVWRVPGLAHESLPRDGFTNGPRPEQSDAEARIVGSGISPQLPVLWVLSGGDWVLDRLPLLDGDSRGGAHGIDGAVIVGWSGDQGAGQHAVVWTASNGTWTVEPLPVPAALVACLRGTSVSDSRIAGECVDPDGNLVGVVWARVAHGWSPVATLAPHVAGAQVTVAGLSGTLAVGNSGAPSPAQSLPVAWRLPPGS